MRKPNFVFKSGDLVCFVLRRRDNGDNIWHLGKYIETLPLKKGESKKKAKIEVFDVPIEYRPQAASEEWQSYDPNPSAIPENLRREAAILGHLSLRTAMVEKKMRIHEIPLDDIYPGQYAIVRNAMTGKYSSG